ncbi:hypothetical protein GOP47_0010282 [Adiantum capillus-veneris]|uniref:Autophagy-related protein 13 N-terminal domain-containing protein n=1 Tax=Adiantum capillus-veneris TaxID=13818 RepID=A0A9D4ZIL8_ADICA|nr:hypothetical protein GOP47_0010282 [Adiantum capillus-veneris]
MMYHLPDSCKRRSTVLSKHSGLPGRSSNPRSLYFLKGLVRAFQDRKGRDFKVLETLLISRRNPEVRQLITESYARFMQVILESRLSTSAPISGDGTASSSAHRPQGSAFNLVLGKSGPMTDKMEPWSRGVWEPMVIDIWYLRQGRKSVVGQKLVKNVNNLAVPGSLKIALEASSSETALLLERWTVEFVPCNGMSSSKMEREPGLFMEKGIIGRYWRAAQNSKYKVIPLRINETFRALIKDEHEAIRIDVEKNLSILLRSLYSTARLLPAHNFTRVLSTRGKHRSRLAYRVSTIPPPFLESDKKDMAPFHFLHTDCHCGHFRVSVAYRRTVPMEEQNSPALPPNIILDYVGQVGKHQLKQLPGENIGHVQSLPSARCHSSFKASNLELQQPATKERALKEGQSWAIIPTNKNQTFDFPFAINEEIHDRKETDKSLSAKSDVGARGKGPQADDPTLGSLLAMLRPLEPLRCTRENLFLSPDPKKTAADALKELKMYINFKDDLLRQGPAMTRKAGLTWMSGNRDRSLIQRVQLDQVDDERELAGCWGRSWAVDVGHRKASGALITGATERPGTQACLNANCKRSRGLTGFPQRFESAARGKPVGKLSVDCTGGVA